jgi:GGDEF domain-containing protein
LEKDHSPEALKGIARISIDLNNLKKANDYNGSHEKGDAYLRLVESILNSPTKPTLKEFAEKRNINIVGVARVGGDEFDVINTIKELNDSKGYVEFGEGINQLQEEIKRRLAEKKDAANIVNFKEEKVLLHYAGITGGEEEAFYKKSEEERNAIIEEIKKEIPPDFEFIATVSCGAATLYDAMMDKENDKDGENKIKHDDDYGRILKKMMGCLFNTSDARMQKNKEKYKQLLAIGNDHERMMYRISTRNIEELKRVKLAQKKDDKIRILNALNNMQKELGGLVSIGSSESTLEGKRAEIAVAEQESKRIDEDLKKME